MNPEIAQYTARIESYIHGKDPLSVQRQTYTELKQILADLSTEVLSRERAPGKWSPREIVAHLADVEAANSWRYRQIIEHSGVALSAYDQNEWARLGAYATADVSDSLEAFRILRDRNLQMFERLTPEEWKRFGVHAERGTMTVQDLVRQIAGHDLNHLEQIRAAVS